MSPPSPARLATQASLRKDADPPFSRVLVANRGEVAVRVIRACHELGIEAVAVFSDADTDGGHVRAADMGVRIGPGPAADSYLRADRIIEAALETGAEAIHPGYGFLAERASFADAVDKAGLVFVGPSAATIAALGDKLAARRLAADEGVWAVPGTLEAAPVGAAGDADAVVEAAKRIGFPILVKAAAGGGGRGMRRVERATDLPAALAVASAEAASAFGDGSVYLERVIAPARHIEVQLLGDRAGTIVAVGERDCSLQRRHQKLIEESPAPGLTEAERELLHEHAVRVARAAGLENAATAEFLFDEDRRFWFLEVNTRLQVEHGVTELTADIDLVREQFEIAAGRPLSARIIAAADRASHPTRHAIEVRLAAEDPGRDFAAAPGRIGRWSMPSGPGIRVDTAVSAGDRVPPDYDPLIAKLLVVDLDRDAAIARLRRALDEVEISGVQTTLPFHRFAAAHPGFFKGQLSTSWVAEHWAPVVADLRLDAYRTAATTTAAAFADRELAGATPAAPVQPGLDSSAGSQDRPSGWREAGRAVATDRWPR